MDPSRGAADAAPIGPRYRFDGVVVDEAAHTLLRDGEPVALEPKPFAVLLVLLRHPGELIGRDQLLDAVWGHRHVTAGVLTRAIAQLRHALGDDPHRPRYIQTQHTLGYRFIGQLLEAEQAPAGAATQESNQASRDPAPPRQPASPLLADEEGPAKASSAAAFGPAASRVPGQGSGSPAAGVQHGRRANLQASARHDDAMGLTVPLALVLVLVLVWLVWSTREPTAIKSVGEVQSRQAPLQGSAPLRASAPLQPSAPPQASAPLQASAPPPRSIAVLPFTSLSADRDDAYFAQGLAEEVHEALAGVPGLKVAARPRAAEAASGPVDVKALGRSMGVAKLLDANVLRDGRRIRVHARLIDAGTGYTLWSDSYERETDDIFILQTEIAKEIVQALLEVLRESEPDIGKQDPEEVACSAQPVSGRVYADALGTETSGAKRGGSRMLDQSRWMATRRSPLPPAAALRVRRRRARPARLSALAARETKGAAELLQAA